MASGFIDTHSHGQDPFVFKLYPALYRHSLRGRGRLVPGGQDAPRFRVAGRRCHPSAGEADRAAVQGEAPRIVREVTLGPGTKDLRQRWRCRSRTSSRAGWQRWEPRCRRIPSAAGRRTQPLISSRSSKPVGHQTSDSEDSETRYRYGPSEGEARDGYADAGGNGRHRGSAPRAFEARLSDAGVLRGGARNGASAFDAQHWRLVSRSTSRNTSTHAHFDMPR